MTRKRTILVSILVLAGAAFLAALVMLPSEQGFALLWGSVSIFMFSLLAATAVFPIFFYIKDRRRRETGRKPEQPN